MSGEPDKSTVTFGDLSAPLSVITRISRQRTSRDVEDLSCKHTAPQQVNAHPPRSHPGL